MLDIQFLNDPFTLYINKIGYCKQLFGIYISTILPLPFIPKAQHVQGLTMAEVAANEVPQAEKDEPGPAQSSISYVHQIKDIVNPM